MLDIDSYELNNFDEVDMLVITDDVRLEDVTDDYAIISAYGHNIHEIIEPNFKVDSYNKLQKKLVGFIMERDRGKGKL